jgi:GDP-L-fucose synthase
MTTLVTGGSGMVGKSLKKIFPEAIYLSSKDYNLTSELDVIKMFEDIKPNTIIHLAAIVGGIIDNINKPAEYFEDNILMNTLLLKYSIKYNVTRFVGVLSTCIYPDKVETYPMLESDLHLGPPTKTNFSYGYAKRSLAVQIDSYNQQYQTKYQYLIPCNLYGEYDKYGDNSHFVAALIKKIYLAKISNQKEITLFGDGTPLRQFLHSDDLAYIIKYCLDNNIYDNMNVATSENLSINEITNLALEVCEANNIKIKYDPSQPNGQHRKDVSIKILKNKIPFFSPISLKEGIKKTYKHLLDNKVL